MILLIILIYILSVLGVWIDNHNFYKFYETLNPTFIDMVLTILPIANTLITIVILFEFIVDYFKRFSYRRFFGLKKIKK